MPFYRLVMGRLAHVTSLGGVSSADFPDYEGTPRLASWKVLTADELYWGEDGKQPLGDFPAFRYGIPCCSQAACTTLAPLIDQSVELLPIDIPDAKQPYFLVNALDVVDALDLDRSDLRMKPDSGRAINVRAYHSATRPTRCTRPRIRLRQSAASASS